MPTSLLKVTDIGQFVRNGNTHFVLAGQAPEDRRLRLEPLFEHIDAAQASVEACRTLALLKAGDLVTLHFELGESPPQQARFCTRADIVRAAPARPPFFPA